MRIPISFNTFVIFMLGLLSYSSMAKYRIAVIPKTKNLSYFEDSYKGCQEVAKYNNQIECLYDGPLDFQDPRQQADVINKFIKAKVDAILISVTDSSYIVKNGIKQAFEKNIPVITYDSDLLPEHQKYRIAYVGTDNVALGKELGKAAIKLKKEKQQYICLQSGAKNTPNLANRVKGVRLALSRGKTSKKLSGENGWYEKDRCPLYTYGKPEMALFQLDFLLSRKKDLFFIAVAGFAQVSKNYIKKISEHKSSILKKENIIITADTLPIQLKALKLGLSTINIGQNPFEMGRKGSELLFQFLSKKIIPSKKLYYVGFHTCNKSTVDTCTDR